MYTTFSVLFLVACSFFLLGSSKVLEVEQLEPIQLFLAETFHEARIEHGNVWLPSLILRLAFHDAGTWREEDGTGGPGSELANDCVSLETEGCEQSEFRDPDNKGLTPAVEFLEGVLDRFEETGISRSDLWQLAANVVIEVCGGPHLKYSWGREDRAPPGFPGRLPAAHMGDFDAIRDRMGPGGLGLSDNEIIAVQGAHTLGFLHKKNSGFAGQWDGTPVLWDNEYFKGLSRVHNGFWPERRNGERKLVLSSHIMLPSDVASFIAFPDIVRRYARDMDFFNENFASGWEKIQNGGDHDLTEVDLKPIPERFIRKKPKHCRGFLGLVCSLIEFRGRGPNGLPIERPLQNLHLIFPKIKKILKAKVHKFITYHKKKVEIIGKVLKHAKTHVEKVHSVVKRVGKHVGKHVKKAVHHVKKHVKNVVHHVGKHIKGFFHRFGKRSLPESE